MTMGSESELKAILDFRNGWRDAGWGAEGGYNVNAHRGFYYAALFPAEVYEQALDEELASRMDWYKWPPGRQKFFQEPQRRDELPWDVLRERPETVMAYSGAKGVCLRAVAKLEELYPQIEVPKPDQIMQIHATRNE